MWEIVKDLVIGKVVDTVIGAVSDSWNNSQDAWNRDYLNARFYGQHGGPTYDHQPSTIAQYQP